MKFFNNILFIISILLYKKFIDPLFWHISLEFFFMCSCGLLGNLRCNYVVWMYRCFLFGCCKINHVISWFHPVLKNIIFKYLSSWQLFFFMNKKKLYKKKNVFIYPYQSLILIRFYVSLLTGLFSFNLSSYCTSWKVVQIWRPWIHLFSIHFFLGKKN